MVIFFLLLIIIGCSIIIKIWLNQDYYRNRRYYGRQRETYNQYEEIDYRAAYQRRYLLTRHEYQAYKQLRIEAEKRGLLICPKVRLLDLVEPRSGSRNYKTLLYKVQNKHVDFVIADKDMYVQAILELDDGSHTATDRQERDHFINQVLTSCGYRVIRTYAINERTLEGLGNHTYENKVYEPYSM